MTLPHLDDESLSAAVDGEATVAEQAHLSTCSRCQAEVQARAAVARAVGAPVTPRSPAAVNAAIAQALGALPQSGRRDALGSPGAAAAGVPLAAGLDSPGAAAVGVPMAPPGGSRVPSASAPMAGPGGSRVPSPSPLQAPTSRRRPSRTWLAGVAGVAAAVVVVGGLVAVMSRTQTTRSTASSPPSLSAGASAASTTIPLPAASALTRDLGAQSDAAVVAQLVTASERAAGAGSNLAVPGVTSTVARNPVAAPDLSRPSPCVAEARRALGGAATDSTATPFVATLRWRGQAAVVVVFSLAAGQAGVIMDAVGCSVLADLP